MSQLRFVAALSFLLSFQIFAQTSDEFVPAVLTSTSNSGLQPLTLNDDSPPPSTREVELWVGSYPVSISTNVDSLSVPQVVSNLTGRLVFRDAWGKTVSTTSPQRTRSLTSRQLVKGSGLSVQPIRTPNGVKLSISSGWRNTQPQLQWSTDLQSWNDLPAFTNSVSPDISTSSAGGDARFFRAVISRPEAPIITATRSTDDRIKVRWKGSGESFRVEYCTNKSDLGSAESTSSQLELSSPAVLRGLNSGTVYYIRIQASGPGGVSGWSEVESVATTSSVQAPPNRRLLIYGSSVAFGVGDPTGKGWAGRLKDSLGTNWTVVNRSIPGDTTTGLLERFDRDVSGEHWDVVWIALSLMNEGILGPNPASAYDGYVKNQRLLINLVRQIGAVPIVSSTYPNSLYGPSEYAYCQRFNEQLNQWGVAGIDFMSSLDDGTGKWLPRFLWDPLHPNADGHEAMFQSIPPGFIDSLLLPKPVGEENVSSLTLGDDLTTSAPLSFHPTKQLTDFTVSFWFKGSNIADKTLCGIGYGSGRIRVPDGSFRYTSPSGQEIVGPTFSGTESKWHHVALVYQSRSCLMKLFLDSQLIGSTQEPIGPIDRITLGGRADGNPWANAVKISFWGFAVHRVPVSTATMLTMQTGKPWKLSADLLFPTSQLRIIEGSSTTSLPSVRGSIRMNSSAWIQDADHPFP